MRLTSVFVSSQSHDRLQVYGGHSDMVMCMAVHKSVVRGIEFAQPSFWILTCMPEVDSWYCWNIWHCLSHSDLHGLLWWLHPSCEAQLDEELPLLGNDSNSLYIKRSEILSRMKHNVISAFTLIQFQETYSTRYWMNIPFLNASQHVSLWPLPSVQWYNCTLIFGMAEHLSEHLLRDHSNPNLQAIKCRWRGCSSFFGTHKAVREVMHRPCVILCEWSVS